MDTKTIESLNKTLFTWIDIWKDYFIDIYWRLINYLIIQDISYLIFCITIIIILSFIISITNKRFKADKFETDYEIAINMIGFIFSIVLIIWLSVCIFKSSFNLIKDLTIPEVRVIEFLTTNYKK